MSDGAGIRAWISVYLKGVCMGAADTVPGVSGGTIAVVLGIYERLITALTELDPAAVRHLPTLHTAEGRGALRSEFRRADVPFLSVLGFGVLSAAATVATAMNAAVTRYPAPTYAFFFGLIGASAVVLYRYVEIGTPRRLLVAVAGASLAFLLTDPALATTGTATLPALFLAGAIAISAMILPGVSGAFLLLVLGQYEYVSGIPRGLPRASARPSTATPVRSSTRRSRSPPSPRAPSWGCSRSPTPSEPPSNATARRRLRSSSA